MSERRVSDRTDPAMFCSRDAGIVAVDIDVAVDIGDIEIAVPAACLNRRPARNGDLEIGRENRSPCERFRFVRTTIAPPSLIISSGVSRFALSASLLVHRPNRLAAGLPSLL